jgi:hypothetical protein
LGVCEQETIVERWGRTGDVPGSKAGPRQDEGHATGRTC